MLKKGLGKARHTIVVHFALECHTCLDHACIYNLTNINEMNKEPKL